MVIVPEAIAPFETDCLLRGKIRHYREDAQAITLTEGNNGRVLYQWVKGEAWARICAPELLWR